jgi:hypothetical protein
MRSAALIPAEEQAAYGYVKSACELRSYMRNSENEVVLRTSLGS